MYADQEKRVQDSEPDKEACEGGVHPESPCKGLNGYNSVLKQSQHLIISVSLLVKESNAHSTFSL